MSPSPADVQSDAPPAPTPARPRAPPKPRVKRACVSCFTAKVRCSGEQPACGRCGAKALECYYDPHGNSRRGSNKRARASPTQTDASDELGGGGGGGGEDRGAHAQGQAEAAAGVEAVPPVVVRQPFFRWLGLTSVVPPGPGASAIAAQGGGTTTSPPPLSGAARASSNPAVALDGPEAEARVRTFYALFDSYLPYMPLASALEQLRRGTLSEVVLVAMSALVKRIRPDTPHCPGAEQLADRAKQLVIAHLALPSLDTVYALVLLAYHEHGADRDSGLWAYCGMAIRASIDLGLHKPFVARDPAEAALRSRIFWAVVCLDRIISCGTGRLTTIPLPQIEVDLPPPREDVATAQGVPLPDPFPTLCRLLLILGNFADAVNGASGASSSLDVPRVPFAVQRELADYQASLPAPLQFSIHTFSAYASAGHAQAFLLLSIWHQAVHLAITQSALLFTRQDVATPASEASDGAGGGSGAVSPQSGSAAISIGDMLAYSGLISNDAFLCTPTLSQPIMMAGRAASALLKSLPTETPKHHVEPLERAVAICQTTLEQMQRAWAGLSWHVESMTKNAREVDLSRIGATITTDDRGMLAKARMDEWAANCSRLLDELAASPTQGEVVGVGLSSWGLSSQPAPGTSEPPPQSTVAVLRSGRASPLTWAEQPVIGDTGILSTGADAWNIDWTAWTLGAGAGAGAGAGGVDPMGAAPQQGAAGRVVDPLDELLGLPPLA
ncbi:hypothetical protein Rhopal_002969-T1 [Rhodotorula paludigena]|uniref:Zn(2)-C6 fungal-type domain-containing protein n=1 Tax=Rhodotorula paludigena TaxID=86838 RepID=A0AAV5GJF3_9BASI|nr:hypothetical protein Rhopal_002969-T1 [Rhodotorula paludigena]